jgi:4-amino-4-deoxy-L-arabinose transferase-like glycosyltransferase
MNKTLTLTEPVVETPPFPQANKAEWARVVRVVEAAMLAIAAIFFALHFVHLRADFPNHSVWMDWAKYTDEGWYGDAAIRHYQLGHWNVPGDFNPAAALPVWPALEAVLFGVTGVSLVAARALTVVIFGLILLCCYALIRQYSNALHSDGDRAQDAVRRPSLAAAIAVLLLAVNPFCFAFSRLAILEPLLILLTLLALLAASAAGSASVEVWSAESPEEVGRRRLDVRHVGLAVALGLLLPLMVLTKTTGIFLFPAIGWMLWASSGYRWKPFLRAAVIAGGVGVLVWGGYYGLAVRPRYLTDYRYLFSANAYTGVTLGTLGSILHDTLFDVTWIGNTLFALALSAVLGLLVSLCFRRLRGNPLTVALLLWVFGYAAFLAYHDNLQPRYYLVIAVPLTMLVAIVFDAVTASANDTRPPVSPWVGVRISPWLVRLTAVVSGVALVFAVLSGARQTIYFVVHPEYTFLSAANQVRDAVDRERAAHPDHSRMLLSISGSDISLITGLPSICDDFGTMTLPDRVATYKPGWFASWNHVEDDKMEALAPMYRLVRVATIPAFDDPERNLLILYRLDPLSSPGPKGRAGRRRSMSVPRRLRTRVGQQPSPVQLKH